MLYTLQPEMGYKELCRKRVRILEEYVLGRHMVLSLPTCSGGPCYYALPLVFDELLKTKDRSVPLVISLLIALMKNQVSAINRRNVHAVYMYMYMCTFGDLDADGVFAPVRTRLHPICY